MVTSTVFDMGYEPILIPDTSAVNCLADDPASAALIAGLRSGFHVRLPFTCVSEIIATTSGDRRRKLLDLCRRLLLSGDCIQPPHEILRNMVESFERPAPFDWRTVDVRLLEAEEQIAREGDFDEGLSGQEREECRTNNKSFEDIYSNAKAEFDLLVAKGAAMPVSLSEFVTRLQNGQAFWKVAQNLYDRVAKRSADDSTIRSFYEECDPFRALMVAVFTALYDRCVRPQNVGPSLRSGRNDTFMATYLPYGHQFVTNDPQQLACYREVVSVAGLDVVLRSYEEFRNGLFMEEAFCDDNF